MFGNMALYEKSGSGGIDPASNESLREFEGPSSQLNRVLGNGQSVQINDAENRVGLVLIGDPVAKRSEEVAKLDRTGGFDAREDTRHGGRC